MSGEPKHTSTGVVVDHVGVRKLTALLVRLESGFQVKIRSGLTEGQRRNPPPVWDSTLPKDFDLDSLKRRH